MPRIPYVDINFREETLRTIDQANSIIREYREQGFDLTLRQLYYQFVARDLIPNKESEYKRLGSVINDGRLAGNIDWLAISDRTRNLQKNAHWKGPAAFRVEVWIEKDALVGILESVCPDLDVPFFSCRGYTSQSEMWRAAQRLIDYDQKVVILHLGDHDPSGIDMSRDIEERLELFGALDEGDEFRRIALNMDQIREFSPPPNPAKVTDSRFAKYLRRYGRESWELDSMEPTMLADLVSNEIRSYRDDALWNEDVEKENKEREELKLASEKWEDLRSYIRHEIL
jgi:hypothetical protein